MILTMVNLESELGWIRYQVLLVAQDLQQCQKSVAGLTEISEYLRSNGIPKFAQQDENELKAKGTQNETECKWTESKKENEAKQNENENNMYYQVYEVYELKYQFEITAND